jgi:hypothetical protein
MKERRHSPIFTNPLEMHGVRAGYAMGEYSPIRGSGLGVKARNPFGLRGGDGVFRKKRLKLGSLLLQEQQENCQQLFTLDSMIKVNFNKTNSEPFNELIIYSSLNPIPSTLKLSNTSVLPVSNSRQ